MRKKYTNKNRGRAKLVALREVFRWFAPNESYLVSGEEIRDLIRESLTYYQEYLRFVNKKHYNKI